jgi:DNA-binding CsgD family transcriptional regulator
VTMEETSPVDRLEIFSRAYALTARERELLRLLAAGIDARAVAARMSLAENTVQDHLKSIFAKTSARSRQALLARAVGVRTPEPPPRVV